MSPKKLCTECEFKNRPYSEYPCNCCTDNQIIVELESLKAKIDNPKTCMFAGTYEADWIMENIIDKRIAEVKGEQE